jgi:protein PsiE
MSELPTAKNESKVVQTNNKKKLFLYHPETISMILQTILNVSLIFLGLVLTIMLGKELYFFLMLHVLSVKMDFHTFLQEILVFFLYFEFISMIVKYFREEYHFPLRYFVYIGITAMVRLIIVDHNDPKSTLLYSFVILVLIVGYYIINKTPRERI